MTMPQKRELPETRTAINHDFIISGHKGWLNVGLFEDGKPGEVFITMEEEGPTINGLLNTIGTLTSVALQYGVPIEVLVQKLSGFNYEPSGQTDNPNLSHAYSIIDYIFRWLEKKFVTGPKRTEAVEDSNLPIDRLGCPNCPDCGHQTIPDGVVFKCPNCRKTVGAG